MFSRYKALWVNGHIAAVGQTLAFVCDDSEGELKHTHNAANQMRASVPKNPSHTQCPITFEGNSLITVVNESKTLGWWPPIPKSYVHKKHFHIFIQADRCCRDGHIRNRQPHVNRMASHLNHVVHCVYDAQNYIRHDCWLLMPTHVVVRITDHADRFTILNTTTNHPTFRLCIVDSSVNQYVWLLVLHQGRTCA